MIELRKGLSDSDLAEIGVLERRSVAADGGRLKLEWATLRSRPRDVVSDLLVRQDGPLVGFVGLYTFGPAVELTGMVDPGHRRQGIATALLDAALAVCRDRGLAPALLVVPRLPDAARRLALARGAHLDHSEFALVQRQPPPAAGADDPQLRLRPAERGDVATIARLVEAGFGHPANGSADRIDRTVVVERAGVPIGTLAVERDGERAGVYGFVIEPALQGQGIGREVLRRTCRDLHAQGVREVRLEVAVENDRALGLYTSLGFAEVATEDYYDLPLR